jgi:ankyrin repeat protein
MKMIITIFILCFTSASIAASCPSTNVRILKRSQCEPCRDYINDSFQLSNKSVETIQGEIENISEAATDLTSLESLNTVDANSFLEELNDTSQIIKDNIKAIYNSKYVIELYSSRMRNSSSCRKVTPKSTYWSIREDMRDNYRESKKLQKEIVPIKKNLIKFLVKNKQPTVLRKLIATNRSLFNNILMQLDLSSAVANEDFETVKLVLKYDTTKKLINTPNSVGIPPLHYAVSAPAMINLLVEHGADVNIKDSQNQTIVSHALYYARKNKRFFTHVINPLINLGYDANSKHGKNYLLSSSIWNFQYQTFRLLLLNGADYNIDQEFFGSTKKPLELIQYYLDYNLEQLNINTGDKLERTKEIVRALESMKKYLHRTMKTNKASYEAMLNDVISKVQYQYDVNIPEGDDWNTKWYSAKAYKLGSYCNIKIRSGNTSEVFHASRIEIKHHNFYNISIMEDGASEIHLRFNDMTRKVKAIKALENLKSFCSKHPSKV